MVSHQHHEGRFMWSYVGRMLKMLPIQELPSKLPPAWARGCWWDTRLGGHLYRNNIESGG